MESVAVLSSGFTLDINVGESSMLVSQIRESGIGTAFSTLALNVIGWVELAIFDVLPLMESVISEARTVNSSFAVSETSPALSWTINLNVWLPSRSPVWFLLQLLVEKYEASTSSPSSHAVADATCEPKS